MESKILRFRKIKLISAGLLLMGFIGGCARNIESASLEAESDIASRNQETAAENEKHYWVNRQGEVFDSTNAPGGGG